MTKLKSKADDILNKLKSTEIVTTHSETFEDFVKNYKVCLFCDTSFNSKNNDCPQCKKDVKEERIIICPLCNTEMKESLALREQRVDNGIYGSGYRSWVISSHCTCVNCGVMFQPKNKKEE